MLEYAVRKEDERFYWVCRDHHTLRRLRASGINVHMINDPRALNLYARTGLWAFAHTGFLNLPLFPVTYVRFMLWHGIGPRRAISRETFGWSDYFLTTTERLRELYHEKN